MAEAGAPTTLHLRRPESTVLEGMYSAAAGMAAQQQRLDATSSDLANVSTTGYKHVRVAFRDLVYAENGRGVAKDVQTGAGAAATQIGRSRAQGAMQQTGRTLDVALQGDGYLAVTGRDGKPAMTRDGNLRLNDRNRLVTSAGLVVTPTVTIPTGTPESAIAIGSRGQVSVGGRLVGSLKLVSVPALSGLRSGDDNTFTATRASGAVRDAPAGTVLTQGSLEASDVDLSEAMTAMIEAQRGYELASKAITFADQMAEIANGVKR